MLLDAQLWYALGKLKAEKVAWEIAEDTGFKLATICPALITGPEFISRNPTATIAYLKGTTSHALQFFIVHHLAFKLMSISS